MVCFQFLIYFRTELLTRAKFSRHVWTGFCGPAGDGGGSITKSVNKSFRNSNQTQVYQVSQILLADTEKTRSKNVSQILKKLAGKMAKMHFCYG